MPQFIAVLAVAFQESLFYACVGWGVWLSFRVLAFPDLSAEGVFPLGAAVAGVLILQGFNPVIATGASILAGFAAGTFTILLNTKLGINSLLAGILTMTGLYSINLTILHGSNLALLHQMTLLKYMASLLKLTDPYWVSIIVSSTIVLSVGIALNVFLHTQLGLTLRATGQNAQMIRSSGVNTDYIQWIGLALANGLVALAGSLVAQLQGFADVGMGVGSVVIGLAAIILGERLNRRPSVGWAIGAVVLGTFLYRLIISLSLRAGLGATNLKLVTVVLVIVSLSLPRLQPRGRHKPGATSEDNLYSTFNR